MKCARIVFLVCAGLTPIMANAASGSLLTAQQFPGTFSDLSFVERMAVLKEGYEPYEILYDANGNCVSGCAFRGMNLEETKKYYEREADEARHRAQMLAAQHPEWMRPTVQTQAAPQSVQPLQPTQTVTQTSVAPVAQTQPIAATCSVPGERQKNIHPDQTVPYGYPMNTTKYITSNYGPRNVANGTKYHMGVDLRAADGTPVFSTLNGVVTNVTYNPTGTCGNYVKIKSKDGFSIRFCHLQDILVKKDEPVAAGCMIARSGHSGMGQAGKPYAPHLHYEIFNQNDKQIPPEPYLR